MLILASLHMRIWSGLATALYRASAMRTVSHTVQIMEQWHTPAVTPHIEMSTSDDHSKCARIVLAE